jgi:hypothetical protein
MRMMNNELSEMMYKETMNKMSERCRMINKKWDQYLLSIVTANAFCC